MSEMSHTANDTSRKVKERYLKSMQGEWVTRAFRAGSAHHQQMMSQPFIVALSQVAISRFEHID
jgi:hypothetical protein